MISRQINLLSMEQDEEDEEDEVGPIDKDGQSVSGSVDEELIFE